MKTDQQRLAALFAALLNEATQSDEGILKEALLEAAWLVDSDTRAKLLQEVFCRCRSPSQSSRVVSVESAGEVRECDSMLVAVQAVALGADPRRTFSHWREYRSDEGDCAYYYNEENGERVWHVDDITDLFGKRLGPKWCESYLRAVWDSRLLSVVQWQMIRNSIVDHVLETSAEEDTQRALVEATESHSPSNWCLQEKGAQTAAAAENMQRVLAANVALTDAEDSLPAEDTDACNEQADADAVTSSPVSYMKEQPLDSAWSLVTTGGHDEEWRMV